MNSLVTFDYLYILIYLLISLIIANLIILLNYIFIIVKADFEKLSAYECGFNPYNSARNNFDVRFYLVAILFIVFDLEVMFIFPLISIFNNFTIFSFYIVVIFILLLMLGFVYEWQSGALNWS